MLIYGYHPVREALRQRPDQVTRLLVTLERGGNRRLELEDVARSRGIAVSRLTESELDRRTGEKSVVHNGFAAEVGNEVGAVSKDRDEGLIVLVEDIQDPRNLGALMRVCEGAGVGRLLIRDRGSAPVSPVAVKASAGAASWLPVERVGSSASEIGRLKKEGYWIYGLAPGGESPWAIDLRGRVVLCLGGEEKGLRHRTQTVCDRLVGLPMRGHVGSLNLATAASAVLYEAVRQRVEALANADGIS